MISSVVVIEMPSHTFGAAKNQRHFERHDSPKSQNAFLHFEEFLSDFNLVVAAGAFQFGFLFFHTGLGAPIFNSIELIEYVILARICCTKIELLTAEKDL